MKNLFIIGESSTKFGYKVGVLNNITKRSFSTTRPLNLGPETPDNMPPIISTTKQLAEETIKDTMKESLETGVTITREKAALITQTRDLFSITD